MTNRIKLLVADDSQANRFIISEEFKTEYDILTAENGVEAIGALRDNPDIAIVLLDLIMPQMDGFEVLQEIADDKSISHIPIIAITSSERNDDLVKALDLGAVDVLTKPLNMQLLQHKLRSVLARSINLRADKLSAILKRRALENDIDDKSGVFNKSAFCHKVREVIDSDPDTKYAIIRFDIDGFKVLNDVYGIEECDRVLKCIGDSLAGVSAPCERVYGRLEADHFALMMQMDDFNNYRISEQLSGALAKEFDIRISIRIGVYVIEDRNLDVTLMCDRALMALRSIKNVYGKHIAFYDESMRISLIERQQVIDEMKAALSEGQFVVYFQPQYNYSTMELHGAEALVRWKHPERGVVPPIKFIPVFEENGFITHLDQFVWEEVCRYQRRWLDEGHEIVPVSVNVSRIDICSLRLAEYFRKLVEKYDLPTNAIRVEITESAYIDNPAQLIGAVSKLREAGFSVEMDDFGSGYSSLNTLKDVPVDMLKLDMKFVEEGSESRGGSILSSVIRMANWLRLPVLAEGVETKAQAEYLKSIGCVFMQGYLFAKPMPADEYEKVLSEGHVESKNNTMPLEGFEDAMDFLNASTQATLMFNSFVGGAAIIEYDGDNADPVRINDKFFDIIDSSHDEYISKCAHLMDAFDTVNKDKFKRALERARESGREMSCELCSGKVHEGKEVWTKARVRYLTSNGDKHLFYLTIENISQRMNLLVSNLRLTDQLTTIINNVPGGIVDFKVDEGGDCTLLYFNDKLPTMFGYTREEYEDEFRDNVLNALYPDDVDHVRREIRGLVDGRSSSIAIRFRHICQNGSFKWVSLNGGRTRRQGSSAFATASVTDLDDEIRAEQKAATKEREFLRQRKLMQAAFQTLPYGIIQLTYNLGEYEMFDCNDNTWKILGYKDKGAFCSEFLFNGYRLGFSAKDAKTMEDNMNCISEEGDGAKFELDAKLKREDGTKVMCHHIVQKVICNNEIEYIQHMFIPVG